METYRATLKHDNGIVKLKVVSLSGKQGEIRQIRTAEGCPQCTIVKIVKIGNDEN
jgi:hypothetical protein